MSRKGKGEHRELPATNGLHFWSATLPHDFQHHPSPHKKIFLLFLNDKQAMPYFLYDTICHTITFEMKSTFRHYTPRRLTVYLLKDPFPISITHLTFGFHFNLPVDAFPPNLTHLTTGGKFNQLIDNLPQSTTHLSLWGDFNRPIDHLPPNLTHLYLGTSFNQPVDSLPQKITLLSFGTNFNQPVDNLPLSITHLTFGQHFNQPVNQLSHIWVIV